MPDPDALIHNFKAIVYGAMAAHDESSKSENKAPFRFITLLRHPNRTQKLGFATYLAINDISGTASTNLQYQRAIPTFLNMKYLIFA